MGSRTGRLCASVETAKRRLVDLRGPARCGDAARLEHDAQARLCGPAGQPACEAEDLIRCVLKEDDPPERAEVLREVDEDDSGAVQRRLKNAGHLPDVVSAEVLASLYADPPAAD